MTAIRNRARSGICFVATGRSGLGHLRRVSTIAAALRRVAPDVPIALLTNAPPQGLEHADLTVYNEITICERRNMAEALALGGAALAVCDTIVLPGAEALPQKLALILRETPAERQAQFSLQGGRQWDAVLIPNPEGHWLPRGDTVPARRVCPLGWIYRRPEAVSGKADGGCADILVATGGGGTKETADALYPMIDGIITAARRMAARPVRVRQAIGPRARAFGALATADEVFDPGGALNRCFAQAGIVLSTAGYNSVLELAVTQTPALLLPIPRSLDDQALRVRQWGAKLGHGYAPDAPDAAAAWLAGQIARPRRRTPVDLGPSGEARAAAILLDILR